MYYITKEEQKPKIMYPREKNKHLRIYTSKMKH